MPYSSSGLQHDADAESEPHTRPKWLTCLVPLPVPVPVPELLLRCWLGCPCPPALLLWVPAVTSRPPWNRYVTWEQIKTIISRPFIQTHGAQGARTHTAGSAEASWAHCHCPWPLGEQASCPSSWEPWRRPGELISFFPLVLAGRDLSVASVSWTLGLQLLCDRGETEVLGLPGDRAFKNLKETIIKDK